MTSPLLITGASGQLGGYLLRELGASNVPAIAWSGSREGLLCGFPLRPVNLADRDAVARAFREARPWAVIHAAAVSRIDACFRDPLLARRVNEQGAALLAELCHEVSARLIYVSTDLVFDGAQGWYREADAPAPLSVYGRTKAAAEQAVLACDRSAVVRVSLLFGPTIVGRPGFFDQQLDALRSRRPCTLFEDEWRTPLSLRTAARCLLAAAGSDVQGVLHVGGPERLTRLEMGLRLARWLNADPALLVPAKQADFPSPEPRPRDVSLDSSRFRHLFPAQPFPVWEEAVAELGVQPGGA